MGTIDVGGLLYEYTVKLTGMTEYGVSFERSWQAKCRHRPKGHDSTSPSKALQSDRN